MLPRVIVHTAVSADGRIDWFTPNIGLFYGLVGRWKEDATLVGSETILKAPDYAPDSGDGRWATNDADTRPLLVIPDSRGRVRNWGHLQQAGYWRGGVALCSSATPKSHLQYLEARGVEVITAGADRVDLRDALEELDVRHGVKALRVDSGGILSGVLLRAGLVHEVSVLIHPALVGGSSPRSFYRAPDLTSPAGVVALILKSVEQLEGGIVWLHYEIQNR